VFGLLAILLGMVMRWKWIRSFWFRTIHLLMILIVVAQALVGVRCPLTTLETYLRMKGGGKAYYGSFMGRCVHELIMVDVEPRVLTVCYCLFGAAVVATLVLVPPRWPWAKVQISPEPPNAAE
jgi:hypothetical protein